MNIRIIGLFIVLSFLLPMSAGATIPAGERQVNRSVGPIIRPDRQLSIPAPEVRTWSQMEAARAREAGGPTPPPAAIPFRPTRKEDVYKALKSQAGQTKALQAPLPAPEAAIPASQAPALINTINFEGVNSNTAGLYPPDTHGAAGLSHFVEITNSHLDIYEKAAPNQRVGSMTLSAFFGYTFQTLYDPRVIYDPQFDRWIMSVNAGKESATVQYFFFAVSQTPNPLGAYYIYQVNVSNGAGSTWDFPQLGHDSQALIFTANVYNAASVYIDARMFAVAKSLVYNGPSQALSPYIFTGLVGTLAPPLVLDNNPKTFLAAADNTDTKVTLYTLTNSGANPPTLSGPATIPVPAYGVPPSAQQPGTSFTLDTSDSRFANAGTQVGNSLFQVHSINSGGFARCRFYEFDTSNLQLSNPGILAGAALPMISTSPSPPIGARMFL